MCRYVLKLKRREFKAVVLMSSQKTLPVSVTVISFLGAVGEEGLMTIPCVVAHMSQLFIDAYISSRWASEREPSRANGANTGLDWETIENGVIENGTMENGKNGNGTNGAPATSVSVTGAVATGGGGGY